MAPGQQGQEVLDKGFAQHAVDLLMCCSDWGGAILGLKWTRVTDLALVRGPARSAGLRERIGRCAPSRVTEADRALRALPRLGWGGSGASRPPNRLNPRGAASRPPEKRRRGEEEEGRRGGRKREEERRRRRRRRRRRIPRGGRFAPPIQFEGLA